MALRIGDLTAATVLLGTMEMELSLTGSSGSRKITVANFFTAIPVAVSMSAGLTVSAGTTAVQALTATAITISGGNALVFSTAQARVIPGATDLGFNNNANNQTNLLIADGGAVTVRGIFKNSDTPTGFAMGALGGTRRISFSAGAFNFLTDADTSAPIVVAGLTATSGTFSGFLKTSSVLVFDTSVADGASSLPQIYRNDSAGSGSLSFQLGNAAGVFRFINAAAGATPFQITAAGAGTFAAGVTASGVVTGTQLTVTNATGFTLVGSTVTSATAGTHGAVPAQVVGYLVATIGGVDCRIPYFNS